MSTNWTPSVISTALVAALAASALGQGAAPAGQQQAVPTRTAEEVAGQAEALFALVDSAAAPQSAYWIGIVLGELPELAKKQLKLDSGLVVEDVLPGSPAAKAEVKPLDVLVRASDKPLAEPADILKAVDEAKEQEMSIVVVREGQQMTLKVKPIKRPQQPDVLLPRPRESDASAELRRSSIQKIEEALNELKGKGPDEAVELYFARPGVVTARITEIELPKSMSISVTREGDGPAKVHVKRDDKEWNVTEDKISELPEDVRRQVESLLGKVLHPIMSERTRSLVGDPRTRYLRTQIAPATPATTAPVPYSARPAPPMAIEPYSPPVTTTTRLHAYRVQQRDDGVEDKLRLILKKLDTLESKSLDELHEEVKRLRKELDELRSK